MRSTSLRRRSIISPAVESGTIRIRSTSETVATQPPIAALPNRTTLTTAGPPSALVRTIVSTYACTREGTAEPVEAEWHMEMVTRDRHFAGGVVYTSSLALVRKR